MFWKGAYNIPLAFSEFSWLLLSELLGCFICFSSSLPISQRVVLLLASAHTNQARTPSLLVNFWKCCCLHRLTFAISSRWVTLFYFLKMQSYIFWYFWTGASYNLRSCRSFHLLYLIGSPLDVWVTEDRNCHLEESCLSTCNNHISAFVNTRHKYLIFKHIYIALLGYCIKNGPSQAADL